MTLPTPTMPADDENECDVDGTNEDADDAENDNVCSSPGGRGSSSASRDTRSSERLGAGGWWI